MKLHKSVLIEKAASKDANRPILQSAYLDTSEAQPMLVATNGHILAAVPVTADKSEQGYISADALKAMRKQQSPSDVKDLFCNGEFKLANGATLPRETVEKVGKYPNWRQVMPAAKEGALRVALNPEELLALAQAIGSGEAVILEIDANDKPIRVLPHSVKTYSRKFRCAEPAALGVIMPISLVVDKK